jgi:hypothetical protein
LPFPEGVFDLGDSLGFDLLSIDTFSAGCISVFVENRGKLDKKRIEILRNCIDDLDSIFEKLTGEVKAYFSELWKLSKMVLEFVC